MRVIVPFLGPLVLLCSVEIAKSAAALVEEVQLSESDRTQQVVSLLKTIEIGALCHPTITADAPFLYSFCEYHTAFSATSSRNHNLIEYRGVRRKLFAPLDDDNELLEPTKNHGFFVWRNVLMAALCIVLAALCSGLIMGIMSLDELMLHIKIRASSNPVEQGHAELLLPLVKKRHLCLVSLLMINCLVDEALPLFLDNLLPSWAAVLLSTTLVLVVSEIIPSAVFTGPDQLSIAAKLSPLANFIIAIAYPVAYPISKLLDHLLHDEDELGNMYNRGELSALVRIQYEERLAAKRRALVDRKNEYPDDASILSDPSFQPSLRTLHVSEVNMLEGALAMKTIKAREVCTRLRHVYCVPQDMILDKVSVAQIYGVGFSRVPVYARNPRKPRDNSGIVGILLTRQLIVVDPADKRRVSTLPLFQPVCISPDLTMIDLLPIFQAGSSGVKGGHMAIVCQRPKIANEALAAKLPIPEKAGVLGIITLEDVIEEMLQDDIYDEGDEKERKETERAQWAFSKWRLFVLRQKKQRDAEQRAAEAAAEDHDSDDLGHGLFRSQYALQRFFSGLSGTDEDFPLLGEDQQQQSYGTPPRDIQFTAKTTISLDGD
jgi:metal transporter CNNM